MDRIRYYNNKTNRIIYTDINPNRIIKNNIQDKSIKEIMEKYGLTAELALLRKTADYIVY